MLNRDLISHVYHSMGRVFKTDINTARISNNSMELLLDGMLKALNSRVTIDRTPTPTDTYTISSLDNVSILSDNMEVLEQNKTI